MDNEGVKPQILTCRCCDATSSRFSAPPAENPVRIPFRTEGPGARPSRRGSYVSQTWSLPVQLAGPEWPGIFLGTGSAASCLPNGASRGELFSLLYATSKGLTDRDPSEQW